MREDDVRLCEKWFTARALGVEHDASLIQITGERAMGVAKSVAGAWYAARLDPGELHEKNSYSGLVTPCVKFCPR